MSIALDFAIIILSAEEMPDPSQTTGVDVLYFGGAGAGISETAALPPLAVPSRGQSGSGVGLQPIPPYAPGTTPGVVGAPALYAPVTTGQSAYRSANPVGLVHPGAPYFAAVQSTVDGSRYSWIPLGDFSGSFKLNEMPVTHASADEVHFLASFHEDSVGGREVLSMGVTPSGRVVIRRIIGVESIGGPGVGIYPSYAEVVYGDGRVVDIATPVNTVRADGKWHSFKFSMAVVDPAPLAGETFALEVDGSVVVAGTGPASGGCVPRNFAFKLVNGGNRGRFMLFNGIDGATRCRCELAQFSWPMSGDQFLINGPTYPINEGSGSTLYDWYFWANEVDLGYPFWYRNVDATLPPLDQFIGAVYQDGRLEIGLYDPTTRGYPRVWAGSLPTAVAYNWQRNPPDYVTRPPHAPDYTAT